MRKVIALKRFAAAAAAVVLAFGFLTNSAATPVKQTVAKADSAQMQQNKKEISDAESKLGELEKKQKELDEKIKSTDGNIDKEKENQAAIEEQIKTVQSTILQLSQSIDETSKKISALSASIAETSAQVDKKKTQIDTGVEDFKKRVRLMYINGTGTYSEILVGATDFYDMLMKMELVKKVAQHDNGLINNLVTLKGQYEKEKTKLENSKKELEISKKNLEEKQKTQQQQKQKLDELYSKSKAAQEKLEKDRAAFEKNKSAAQKESEDFEAQIQKLYKQQEAIKKKEAEEAERRRKAALEAERKRKAAEEAERQRQAAEQAAANQQSNSNSQTVAGSGTDSNGNSTYTDAGGTTTGNQTTTNNSSYGYQDKSQFTWPVPGFYHISYGVGWRWGAYHAGIDIWSEGIRGASIVAAASGTVIQVNNVCPHDYGKNGSCGCGGGYGKYCIIDHGNGYWTLYGHSQNIIVTQGQHVEQGQTLGYVGSTGFSTGDHLHFEIRLNGKTLDPTNYV